MERFTDEARRTVTEFNKAKPLDSPLWDSSNRGNVCAREIEHGDAVKRRPFLHRGFAVAHRRLLEAKPKLDSRANPMRSFLCDHHCRGTGISACDRGHHARVDNPQPGDTAHAKMAVEHDHRVGETSHPDGANRMENRGSDITRQLGQLGIRVVLAARFVLFRQIFGERWLLRMRLVSRSESTATFWSSDVLR